MGGAGGMNVAPPNQSLRFLIYMSGHWKQLFYSAADTMRHPCTVYVYTHSHAAAAAVVRSTWRQASESAIGPIGPLASAHFCGGHAKFSREMKEFTAHCHQSHAT